jgi:hypothetical protein
MFRKVGFKSIRLNNERINGFFLLNYLVIWGLKKQMNLWGYIHLSVLATHSCIHPLDINNSCIEA